MNGLAILPWQTQFQGRFERGIFPVMFCLSDTGQGGTALGGLLKFLNGPDDLKIIGKDLGAGRDRGILGP